MAEKLETETEPDFVVVCASEAENAERIELPTSASDSSLCVQTLMRAFPHAHGLKYKNPSTGAYRALLADTSGNVFYKPAGGWHNKLFIVISSQPLLASSTLQSTSDTNNKSKSTNMVAKSEPKTPRPTTSSSVDVSNTVPFESSPTISTTAKKAHSKSDQNAKRRKLMVVDSDEDEALSSGSENCGDKRLRQSGGRAGSSKQKRLNSSTARPDENESLPRCSELIILGLPYNIDEKEIYEYFKQFGGLSSLDIKRKVSGNSKGYGFLRMATFDGQMLVLKKANHIIGNRKCQVRVPTGKNGEERQDPTAGTKVFVGRLQERTTSTSLQKYFNDEAKRIDENSSVIDVYIPKPFRAFAFVTFSNPTVASKIIKRGTCVIDGATLSLQSAQPKNAAPSSGAAGGRSPSSNSFVRGNSSNLYSDSNNYLYDDYMYASYEPRPCHGDLFPSGNPNFLPPPNLNRLHNQPFGAGSSRAMSGHHGSQILASGLETLNLNNMKPELVSALKALMSSSSASSPKTSQGPISLAAAMAESSSFSANVRRSPSTAVFPLLGSQRLFGGPGSGGGGGGANSSGMRGVGSGSLGGSGCGGAGQISPGVSARDFPPGFDDRHHYSMPPRRNGGGGSGASGSNGNSGGGTGGVMRNSEAWR